MQALTIKPDMTRQEAEEAIYAFNRSLIDVRTLLLEMYDRKAHKAVGYGDFGLFVQKRLGMEYKQDTLDKMRQWARVERVLRAEKQDRDPVFSVSSAVARELAKLLDTPELLIAAYKRTETLAATGTAYNAPGDQFLRDLKNVVRQAVDGRPINDIAPANVHIPDEIAPPEIAPPMRADLFDTPSPDPEEEDEPDPFAAPLPVPSEKPAVIVTTFVRPEPDWKDWEISLDIAAAWVNSKEIDGDDKKIKAVLADLCAVTRWIESEMTGG